MQASHSTATALMALGSLPARLLARIRLAEHARPLLFLARPSSAHKSQPRFAGSRSFCDHGFAACLPHGLVFLS
jgi:hypothetical protein